MKLAMLRVPDPKTPAERKDGLLLVVSPDHALGVPSAPVPA